jgi:hypothetical protein
MKALVCVAVLCLSFVVFAQIATAGTSAPSSRTIRILEVPEGFTPLSNADFTKLKPGDGFAYVQGIYTWSGNHQGRRIGHLDGTCQIVSNISAEGTGKAYCIAHMFLADGDILFQGIQPFAAGLSRYRYPITGGTGRYQTARGWVSIRDLSESGKTADVFHLVL